VVQDAVNRAQTTDDVLNLVLAARDSGFESISFDLIYGLPHQTVKSFDKTLELVIAMRPDRLAVYNYAHLPQRFKGQRMINDADIPSPEVKLDILHRTIDSLCGAGYEYIGMDHFALPDDELVLARANGTLQRNFQGYSTHRECDLVALGVSAIGSIGNVFAQSSVSTMEYEALIENGQLPIRKGIAVDDDDLLRADVIQALMCYDKLSFDCQHYAERPPVTSQHCDGVRSLHRSGRERQPLFEGHLIQRASRLQLASRGYPVRVRIECPAELCGASAYSALPPHHEL